MAGSLNKVCEGCGSDFTRVGRMTNRQWKQRRFCSRKCAATKCKLPPEELKRLYESGMSSAEIAEMSGVSAQAVRRSLKACGAGIRNLSDAMKLSHNRPGMSDKFSRLATGRKHSEETKKKMSKMVGPDHPLWTGGLTMTAGGYLQFTSSAANGANAGRLLHQVICEWKEGKRVGEGFHVHHIDGNKLNNHPDNLVPMSASDHARLHMNKRINENA